MMAHTHARTVIPGACDLEVMAHTHDGTHTCLNSYTWSSWPWSNGTPHTTWHNTTTTFECDSFHYGTFQSQAWQAWWLALCLLTLNDIAVYIWREKLSTKSLQRLYLERRGRLTNNEWVTEWVSHQHTSAIWCSQQKIQLNSKINDTL